MKFAIAMAESFEKDCTPRSPISGFASSQSRHARVGSKSAPTRLSSFAAGPCEALVFLEAFVFRCAMGALRGAAVNPDTGAPLIVNDKRVLASEFENVRRSEMIGDVSGEQPGKDRRSMYSPLWQADGRRIRRFAPLAGCGKKVR